MKIFVSHAIKDNKLIDDLKLAVEPHGLQLLLAEHYSDMNHSTITEKIETMIAESNVALILLTENGFNYGKGYIEYDPQEPETAIDKIKRYLIDYWENQIPTKQQELEHQTKQVQLKLQREKEKEQQVLKIGLGILAGILVLSMINE